MEYKLNRNNSQDQGFLENYHGTQGRVTYRELMDTYGKVQDVRSGKRSSEKVLKHRSVAKGSIDMEQIKSLVHKDPVHYPV